MSDIIKSGFISFSDEKRTIKVIDKNDPKILKSTGEVKKPNEGVESRLNGEDSSLLDSVHSDINYDVDLGGGPVISENMEAELNELKETATKEGYDEGYTAGKEEGYDAGYKEGMAKAEEEIASQLSNMQAGNMLELDTLKGQLVDEFNNYKADLEPKMLTIIEGLVSKLVGEKVGSSDTILHLIKCGLDELEIHGDLIIKVSGADLDYVVEHKHELTEELSEKITVEVLKDQQLEKNEVVIETEMGTIESSLGVQMEGLLKELRLIKDSLAE